MRRAVREEQKQARRQAILDVAWELFSQRPYDQINVIDIARGAGLAKGTVYIYFDTKEELFLTIQRQQFQAWFDDLEQMLHTAEGVIPPAQLAEQLTHSLAARPDLIRLFAILHVVLERNVTLEAALSLKHLLQERVSRCGALLEERLPYLAPGQGPQLLLQIYALVIGVQHLADPAPVVLEAFAQEPQAVKTQSILQGFGLGLLALIAGLLTVIGGLRMQQLRSYGLAISGAIAAAIPCISCMGCCGVGEAVGIWAIVVLMNEEVRRAFQ